METVIMKEMISTSKCQLKALKLHRRASRQPEAHKMMKTKDDDTTDDEHSNNEKRNCREISPQ